MYESAEISPHAIDRASINITFIKMRKCQEKLLGFQRWGCGLKVSLS